MRKAACVVVTAPGTQRLYHERYGLEAQRSAWIPNGYDEENFTQASRLLLSASARSPLHLLHSGILYPHDRDPSVFFAALATLARRGVVTPDNLRVTLRASGHDDRLDPLAARVAADEPGVHRPFEVAVDQRLPLLVRAFVHRDPDVAEPRGCGDGLQCNHQVGERCRVKEPRRSPRGLEEQGRMVGFRESH